MNVGSSLRVSRLVESFLHEICKVLRISGIQFAHPTETHSSRSTCLKTTTISFLSGTLAVHAKNAVVVLIETFLTPRSQTHNSQMQLSPTSLEPGTYKTHTRVPDPHRITCGGSTQAPLPRKTLQHKVRSRKPLSNLTYSKVNPNQNKNKQ